MRIRPILSCGKASPLCPHKEGRVSKAWLRAASFPLGLRGISRFTSMDCALEAGDHSGNGSRETFNGCRGGHRAGLGATWSVKRCGIKKKWPQRIHMV